MINQRPNPQVAGEVIVNEAELKLIERLADVGKAVLEVDQSTDFAHEAREKEGAARRSLQLACERARKAGVK